MPYSYLFSTQMPRCYLLESKIATCFTTGKMFPSLNLFNSACFDFSKKSGLASLRYRKPNKMTQLDFPASTSQFFYFFFSNNVEKTAKTNSSFPLSPKFPPPHCVRRKSGFRFLFQAYIFRKKENQFQ